MVIQELTVPVDTTALAQLITLRDQLDAKITDTISHVDTAGLWELDGAVSMTGWLTHQAHRPPPPAARPTRPAPPPRPLPAPPTAWHNGTLHTGHVDTIIANVGRRRLDLFARTEQHMV